MFYLSEVLKILILVYILLTVCIKLVLQLSLNITWILCT